MEQKRTVWIVIAAGIFLLVVLGAAIVLYAPEAKRNTTASYQRDNGAIWMSPQFAEQKRSEQYSQVMDPEPAKPVVSQEQAASPAEPVAVIGLDGADKTVVSDTMNVYSTGTTNVYTVEDMTTTIDLNGNSAGEASSSVVARNKAAENAIRETASVRRSEEVAEVSEPARVVKATPKKAAPAPKPVAKAPAAKPAAPAAKPAAKPATQAKTAAPAKTPDRFWVQVASYTSKKNADEARAALESAKIQCEVFTADAKGQLHYRVRVGPYTTQSEAKYWQERIKTVPFFASSSSFIVNSSK